MGTERRTVLVAGASAGIGKGIAQAFADHGDRVIMGARSHEKLEAAAREIASGDIVAIAGDFSSPAFIDGSLSKLGPIDVLVANFGDTDTPPGFDTSDEDWERLLHANLTGPARLARAVARGMKQRGEGAILFVGSICGREALGAPIAYNAGKAALRAVTKTMARELGPFGVRVNLLTPGNVIFAGGRWARKRDANPQKIEEMLVNQVPLRRFGTPQDIAQAALFLCSDGASFVTGAELVVDGGQTTSF
jgi:3-oxoacyl-[acyl-carrier protein] reductase